MAQVRFEPTISVLELVKTVYALDRAAAVMSITYPVCIVFLNLRNRIIYCDEYKIWKPLLSNFSKNTILFRSLGPHITPEPCLQAPTVLLSGPHIVQGLSEKI
jgi:hypothetical protein